MNLKRRQFQLESLETRSLLTGLPIISEFLADNDNTLMSSSGASDDWIEVFNSGSSSIDLEGWYLTDDASRLDKWTFPSTILNPGEYLVAFASGCEFPGIQCADPSVELHTNFRLNAEREYLALVQPDGQTIVSQFGTAGNEFRRQFEDVSFGIAQAGESIDLVSHESRIEILVPTDNSLGTRWTQPDFDSATWLRGQDSVGYDTSGDGETQELRLDFNDDDTGEPGAENTEEGFTPFTSADSGSVVDGVTVTITGFGEARVDDRDRSQPTDDPPNFTYDQIYDDFIFANRTSGSPGLRIELAGLAANQTYDLKIRSYDDGSTGERVSRWTEALGNQTIVDDYRFDGSDTPTDNDSHSFAASLISSSDGRMVIEGVRNGGTSHGVFINSLELSAPSIVGMIGTDVADAMNQKSSSLLTRIPFTVDTVEFNELSLAMQFDAGFVAYLNGSEVARQNAPGTAGSEVAYDAVATAEPTTSETLTVQSFGLSEFIPLLKPGETNILAIHGLNSSAADGDMLIAPRLVATSIEGSTGRYFSPPTPGARNDVGHLAVVSDTSFSHDRGFYSEPFDVQITSDTPGATIIYTVDGSPPSLTSGVQVHNDAGEPSSATVRISTTTNLRAMAIKDKHLSTNIDTQTYIFLEDVIRQDPLNDPDAPEYPLRWQANATADFEMDPEVVAEWDDDNPANEDFGIRESLMSIPTMSIVMEHEDLWGTRGIYRDATRRGPAYRHAGSVEYFDPHTREQFQLNAGVQMHGNASRDNVRLKKHSFRLIFSNDYGPGNLRFPLFEDTDNETFNTLVLRAHFTDAFATRTATDRYSPMDSLYMRDVWMRDTQLAMGSPSTHNTYVHLYINGLYWGIYNPAERPDDAFLSQYLGGEREDWDIIKDFNELDSGERTAWNDMFRLARSLRDADNAEAIYQQLQGNRADGTSDPDAAALLDVDNLIDFMILHLYAGVEDWPHHNWYASRNRVSPGKGFKFYVWDQEIALDGRFRDLTGVGTISNHRNTPAELYHLLRTNVDSFNMQFADRVELHFSEGGALSLAENQARWDRQAAFMEAAIIAESARWGDAREGERISIDSGRPAVIVPTITVDTWRAEVANVRDNYMPRLDVETLDNFQNAGLMTPVSAPAYSHPGGEVPKGFEISVTAALTAGVETPLVVEGGPATALVPQDGTLDAPAPDQAPLWTASDFDDSSWISGTGGVGFEKGSGNGNLMGLDLLSDELPPEQRMDRDGDGDTETSSFYSRFAFNIDPTLDLDFVNRMVLEMKFDDGFAAFLNGSPLVSDKAPDDLAWDSRAAGSGEANRVFQYNVSKERHLLRHGENVLAIQGMNRSPSSNDLFISPELIAFVRQPNQSSDVYFTTDGSDPRALNGDMSSSAKLFTGSLPITETTTITARGFEQGQWGPIKSRTYVVNPAGPENLAITEVNYNPYDPSLAEVTAIPIVQSDDFEFIEIQNTSQTETVSLVGLSLSDGVTFDFPDVSLAPGEFGVVVGNLPAFRLRYGDDIAVLGEWTGRLANGGERVALTDVEAREYLAVNYNDGDPWPEAPDGNGATLELISASPTDQASKFYRWRSSAARGGTPGSARIAAPPVIINEVLTRPDGRVGQVGDAIELHNASASPIDVGGWYLSDSSEDLFKFQIPAGTIIPAEGFAVFTEADFNPTPQTPGPKDFGLSSSNGDDVWLVVGDETTGVSTFVDEAHFRAARLGQPFARVVNSAGRSRLTPVTNITLGSQNAAPAVGGVVMAEINYHPAQPPQSVLDLHPELELQDLEFVELLNTTANPIDLNNLRLRGGVDIDFQPQLLDAGASVVVLPFNPNDPDNGTRLAAFRANYSLNEDVLLVGGFAGQLGNSDDRITLLMRDPSIDAYVVEDEVLYDDRSPWPADADGLGLSLMRITPPLYGNEPANWQGAVPSPGRTTSINTDFNQDGVTNAADIDLLCQAVGGGNLQFDLNGNQVVDQQDVAFLLDQVLRVPIGDANLDGNFDSTDLVQIFVSGQYEDNVAANSGWATGDWNCDQEFNTSDLVAAFQAGAYVSNAVAQAVATHSQAQARSAVLHDIAAGLVHDEPTHVIKNDAARLQQPIVAQRPIDPRMIDERIAESIWDDWQDPSHEMDAADIDAILEVELDDRAKRGDGLL